MWPIFCWQAWHFSHIGHLATQPLSWLQDLQHVAQVDVPRSDMASESAHMASQVGLKRSSMLSEWAKRANIDAQVGRIRHIMTSESSQATQHVGPRMLESGHYAWRGPPNLAPNPLQYPMYASSRPQEVQHGSKNDPSWEICSPPHAASASQSN